MKPRDWFGVGIRLFGVYFGFRFIEALFFFFDLRFGLTSVQELPYASRDSNPYTYLFYSIPEALLAGCFLFGAEYLICLSYGEATGYRSCNAGGACERTEDGAAGDQEPSDPSA